MLQWKDRRVCWLRYTEGENAEHMERRTPAWGCLPRLFAPGHHGLGEARTLSSLSYEKPTSIHRSHILSQNLLEEVRDAHGFLTNEVAQLQSYWGHHHKIIGNTEDSDVSIITKTKNKMLSPEG